MNDAVKKAREYIWSHRVSVQHQHVVQRLGAQSLVPIEVCATTINFQVY